MLSRSYYRTQLKLAIGAEAFDAIPEREPNSSRGENFNRPPVQRRPRIEARQRIILSGLVPAIVAAGFTVAETAVLCVLAEEYKRRGVCTLTIAQIGYRAQVCRTIVQRALRLASRYDLITIGRRRLSAYRNLSNIVTITSRVWVAWLRLAPRSPRAWGGGGFEQWGTNVTGNLVQFRKKEVAEEETRRVLRFRPKTET